MRSTLCWITLGLWIVTIGVAGWFFVQGWTMQGTDGRTQIMLAPAERDLILGEMRLLLKAVHGVVTGLAGQDQEAGRTQMEQAARSAGMHMADKDMDVLADAIANKETSQQILQRLSSMTARCTACHDMYRFGAGQ
jgi:hypothetical protein